MFSIFRKRPKESTDLGWLGTDIHSHLLPGIDDGSPDEATSLELIRGLQELGFTRLITTPHVLWELYPNTAEAIRESSTALQQALERENIRVSFRAAAEYFIDDHFDQQLAQKAPLLTLKDNLVLVEFSMITAPFDLQQVIFELQVQGYQPPIAHPERYIYLRHNKAFYDDMRDWGCLFQVNLLSLMGHYGSAVQDLAAYLVQKEYYDYAGTDLHGPRHLQQLQKLGAAPLYQALKGSGRLKNHLL